MRICFETKVCLVLLAGLVATTAGLGQGYAVDQNGNVYSVNQPPVAPNKQSGENNPIAAGYAQRQGGALSRASMSRQANSYQQWQDPAEGAFTVSLPRGWQISGGTQRTTRIEPHYVVRAQSPTGGVQLFMDDPRIAVREIPNAYAREGTAIPSPWGGRILVERYRPAPQSAQDYVQKALCSTATQFQGGIIPGETDSLNREFSQIAQAEGKRIHVDAGELSFKCGDRLGYVYAVTLQAWQPGAPVSMWLIYRIAGYLATPAESSSAATAIHAMLGSFQMNQQWLQSFARECNDVAGNVIRESNAVTQASMERAKQMDDAEQSQYASWKKNSDANFNAIEKGERARMASPGGDGNGHDYNAQLNQKTVCNSVGDCQPVDASVTNYWFDCSGKAYPGSESGDPPSSSLSACWNKGH